MAENYKHLYEQMKKMVELYQDEIVPQLREQLERAKQSTWISCAERLPTKEDANKDGNVIAVGKYSRQSGVWDFDNVKERYVSHWMPLPMPPKGDE